MFDGALELQFKMIGGAAHHSFQSQVDFLVALFAIQKLATVEDVQIAIVHPDFGDPWKIDLVFNHQEVSVRLGTLKNDGCGLRKRYGRIFAG